MDDPRNPSDYSVKEILTDFVLPRLDAIEKSAKEDKDAVNERLSKLEEHKNRIVGAMLLIGAFMVPMSVPVITTVLATIHHG